MSEDIELDDARAHAEDGVRQARQASSELQQTKAAFAGLKQAGIEAIIDAGTSPESRAKVERLIICLQTLRAVEAMLTSVVSQGEMANYALAWAEQNLLRR